MNVIALIVGLVGVIGTAMKLSGFSSMVRPVDDISAPIWAGIAVGGFLMWIVTRRPGD